MIAAMKANEKISAIVTELFVRGKKNQHLTCFYIAILFQSA